MPEGPSLVILREELAHFAGRKVERVAGSARIELTRMQGLRLRSVRTWGKHLLFEFDDFSLRIHLLLYGRCRVTDPESTVEWKGSAPRVTLDFKDAIVHFHACSAKFVEGRLDDAYEWRADVMSDVWDPAAARAKLRSAPDRLVCDALLDQDIFSGVGNIIKNEVLFRTRIHPLSRLGVLPPRKLGVLVADARDYSFQFLEWKRAFVLKSKWQVHTRSTCPRCGSALRKDASLGKARRRSFCCERCQILYT